MVYRVRPLVSFAGVAALALALFGTSCALAQETQYPARRITFVVGFAPGGFADTLARVVGQKLSERSGQPVIVENRAGAAGNLAAKLTATSAPDGYTVLVTTTALAINQSLYKKLDYAAEDLVPVAMPASSPESISIHPSNPAGSLSEFLNWAKDREITFATAGVGSGSHLAGEYFFKEIARVRATHVPFRGGAPAIQGVLGNQVDAVVTSFGVVPHIAEGKLRGLGVASSVRLAVLANVPTLAEAGYPGFEAASWVGFFVPAKTSPGIVGRLNQAINEIVAETATEKQLTDAGYQLTLRDVTGSGQYLKSEIDKWGRMVRATGIAME